MTVKGSNFAPMGAAALRCLHAGASVPASFVSGEHVRCAMPPAPVGTFDRVAVLSHARLGNSSEFLSRR